LQLAVDLYAGDQVAAGLFMTLIWWYATKNHRLVDRSLPDSTVRTTLLLDAGTTLWFVLSICVSFVSLAVTVYMWLGVFPAHRLMHYIWRDPMK
jgi:phosphotransferase system  glucose/maltose/N-acetylglucosamine-specific IIC component